MTLADLIQPTIMVFKKYFRDSFADHRSTKSIMLVQKVATVLLTKEVATGVNIAAIRNASLLAWVEMVSLPILTDSDQLCLFLTNSDFSAVKFGRMTKCQRELLLDQAESYRNEMEKKHKEMSKFDFNSTGERSDLSDSSGSNQSSPDCKPFILNLQGG